SLITGLAFNPDGSLLASSGFDNVARIYDVATGQQVLTLPGHGDVVWGVTFSPDGNFLATAGRDQQARVYLLALDKLEELAESRVTRSMTEAECQQFLHKDSCPF
ncbi:MAG: WD40 repeat domain-containing protein, partial [Candidatus Promineifilaceae bacterium]